MLSFGTMSVGQVDSMTCVLQQPRSGGSNETRVKMGSFSKLIDHVVFSAKCRRKTITDDVCERLCEYVGEVVRNVNGSLIEIGGIEDHVHLMLNLSPAKSFSDSVRDINSNASK